MEEVEEEEPVKPKGPPAMTSLDARATLAANLFLLNGPELGYIMSMLEQECPQALEKIPELPENVEINVDTLDAALLAKLSRFANEKAMPRKRPVDIEIDDITGKRSKKKRT